MDIADLGRMGFLPLRDHDVNRRHNAANTLYGVQMEAPDQENKSRPERGTAGDVVGPVLVKAKDGEREGLGSWAFAMPAMAETPPRSTREGTSQVADVPVQSFTPIQDRADTSPLKRYEAFQPLPATVAGSPNRGLPRDYPVLLVNALREDKAAPLAFPSGPLVAVNKAGEPGTGSLVSDCQNDESMDPERQARLQSLVRVARVQDPVLPGGPNGGVLALQYGVSGKDEIAGYGLIAMPPFGGNGNATPVPANAVNVGTQPRPGNPGTATRDGLAVLFGPMSAARGGPITLGDASCQHVIGATLDGERVQPAHLSSDAVIWQGPGREGPVVYDRGNYSNPSPGPRLIPAHIRLDPSAPYMLPTGPNGAPRQHLGMWRIEAESWVEEQKDGPPPTGDAFPPPPTTVVRTPGGASGPGDYGSRIPGDGGSTAGVGRGQGDNTGPGERSRGGKPPPVAGGGVRGPGGGNPEPDSPWTVGPWGYTNPAWPLGIDTSLYRPFPDPYAPIGPYDFGFGYGDGFIATAGTAGRYLNVQNNAFRPYDYAAIPPVLANPYPGVSKASFPNPISTTGIAVKAFPTNSLAQDTRRTPTNDPFLEARRPQTANLEGYAYGNGFDGGWTYTNPPGTRTPTGKGGLVMLPGDLTLQQYRTGSYPTQPATTFVAVKDHVGIGWGVPLANGGVQGVRAVADSAGLSFRPTDSSGVEIAGVGLRIGEGGVIVTGKLTVTGRLDPTTLEITDTAGAQVPNGKWGFGFDSTFHASKPYWFRGDTNVRTAIALAGETGLSKRYIEGLTIFTTSSSNFSVRPGSCRNMANDADMALAAQADCVTGGGGINGLETKIISAANCAITSGSAVITGTGTSFLSAFQSWTLTGTSNTVTASTTVTGNGTKYLSECAVGDMYGNTTGGFARITAIASDTSMTVASALSLVNGAAVSRIEGSCVGIATGTQQRVMNLISSNTSITCSTNFTSSLSSQNLYHNWFGQVSEWLAVWLVSGGSGTGVVLSKQRTKPYTAVTVGTGLTVSPTGYDTSYRRIGWLRIDSAGNLFQVYYNDGVGCRWADWETQGSDLRMISNASSTASWTAVACETVAPPTARRLLVNLFQYAPNTANPIYVRGRSVGSSTVQRARVVQTPTTSDFEFIVTPCPCDGAQYVEHGAQAGATGDGTYMDVVGYEDVLE